MDTLKRFFASFAFLFLLTSCHRDQLTDPSRYYLIEEPLLTASAVDMWKAFHEGKFQEQSTHSFNAGFTTSHYWLLADIPADAKEPNRYLEIGTSQINEIHFFRIENNVPVKRMVTGDYLPYKSRPIETLEYDFPIPADGGQYLLLINKRNESLQLTFTLRSANDVTQHSIESSMLMGLMSGAIVLMVVFGLFLFLITKEKVYLFYLLYITVAWLYIIANQGYGYKYLWPGDPWFAGRARPLFSLLTVAFSLHFIRYYAGRADTRWIQSLLNILMVLSYALTILVLLPGIESKSTSLGYYFQSLLPMLTGMYIIFLLTAIVQKIVHKNKMAMFYLVSILPIVTVSLLQLSYYAGGLDISGSYLQHYGQATGMVLEAVILMFGLAYRFNSYRIEREKLLVSLNRQQQKYANAIITTQRSERRQLADQLHDVAGSLLSAARLNLSSVREKNFVQSEEGRKKLETAERAVSDISNMLRNLSHALSPVMLEKVGFKQSVEKIVGIFNASGKIRFELSVIGFETENAVMYEKYAVLYGILYELMNNIAKHSGASHGLIQLIEHEDTIVLMIEDNGVGLNEKALDGATHGLSAIQSKVHYMQGTIAMDKALPTGLMVTIEIPKHDDESYIGG